MRLKSVSPASVSLASACLASVSLLLTLSACDLAQSSSALPEFEEWTIAGGLRLGDLDDPIYAFGTVGAIVVAEDGTLYSAHPREARIRAWSAEGQPLGMFGGPGQGPGEFRSLGEIGIQGDSLWAMDTRNSRVTWFGLGDEALGEVLGTIAVPVQPRTPDSDPFAGRVFATHLLPDGSYFGRQSGLLPQMAECDSTLIRSYHLAATSEVLHTLNTTAFLLHHGMAVPNPGGEGWLYGSQPFADQALTYFEPSSQQLLIVDRPVYQGEGEARFTVTRLSANGDTLLHRSIPYTPEPLPETLVEQVLERLTAQWKTQLGTAAPGDDDMERMARGALFTPGWFPPVAAAGLGPDGTIWLRVPYSGSGRVPWMIFDADGDAVARVPLATSFEFRGGDATTAWGVTTDNQGTPYVTLYRVGPEESEEVGGRE